MRKWIVCLLTLCLCLICCAAVHGEAELNHITDSAGLLTKTQYEALEAAAQQISQTYNCGVYLITVQDYTDFTSGSVYSCAKGFYEDYDLGMGTGQDGVLLLLSMEERDYSLIAYGTFGNTAFSDYGKDVLADAFLPALRDNDWYEGFSVYLAESEKLLEQAAAGTPVVSPGECAGRFHPLAIVLCLVLSSGIAIIVCLVLKGSMRSVRAATEASAYVSPGGTRFTVRQDQFTHRTVTRRKIETQSSSSNHGGGFSGKSGKF